MESLPSGPGGRLLAYGLAGWAIDSLFVFAHTGRRRPSSLLNVPVYALAQPLFEPVHNRIRPRPVVHRAAVYGIGILGVEYTSGRLLRRLVGSASNGARAPRSRDFRRLQSRFRLPKPSLPKRPTGGNRG